MAIAIETLTSEQQNTVRTSIGLGNVNNTDDASKPISSATQTALDSLATSINSLDATLTSQGDDITALQTGKQDALTVIAGTNAAVTMLVNRHYEIDGSILGADRIYELVAPTAIGDRIRISLTNGNATHSVILQGDTGITLNGGAAATELTRLFIAREYIEFRATSLTNYDVYDDGRANEYCEIYGITNTGFVGSAYTRFAMAGANDPYGLAKTNCIVPRRTGVYSISAHSLIQPSGGNGRQLGLAFDAVGSLGNAGALLTANFDSTSANVGVPISISHYPVSTIGNGFFFFYFTDGIEGTNQYFTSADLRPRLSVVRVG